MKKSMESVFSGAILDDEEFDAIFDQEDSLIDTVVGVDEAGDPLTGKDFDELHQTEDDDVTPDDIKDELGDEHDMGNKNAEGTDENEILDTSVKGEEGKESDADKLYKDAEEDYQDDKKDPKPDEDSVTDTIEKGIDEAEDIEAVLGGDDEEHGPDCTCEACSKAKKESAVEGEVKNDKDSVPTEPEDVEESIDIDHIFSEDTATGADSDVKDIVDADPENDQKDIDAVMDDAAAKKDLSYELSDEDLIDAAINGDV